MPVLEIRLHPDAHEVLTKAAGHRRKTIERICEDILLGTALRGSIEQQVTKALTYRASSEKQKEQARVSARGKAAHAARRNREIGAIAQSTPCAEV